MIYRIIGKLAALALMTGAAATANTIIYSNTTTDTLFTQFFSTGPFSELGDQIHLAGTDRLATSATVQFFNNGNATTFNATLRLYQVGAPVGAQIGSNFVVNGINAPNGVEFNVTFAGLNVVVPNDVIFTVSESGQSGTSDIGVDMFEPPTIGTSSNQFMIDKQGSSFAHLVTVNQNVFFELDATTAAAVPEPGSLATLACGIACLLTLRKRRYKA